ncbi:hypothetical protein DSO57_1010424 [Entomophthora muscae]|uniref:Uncharacterized protein n=1 Tax=Entomophthora muscae TaxID=34485 RepID=A0ACC2S8L4_9FUNG|nr:hypothetical protein DSO57_1010424 [Entomophthora muscae]
MLASSEPPSKIFIGSDHAGFKLKGKLLEHLKSKYNSITVQDFGSFDGARCDYPDIAKAVCENLIKEESNAPNEKVMGVLICGSGIGISIAANKYPSIRCALCHNTYTSEMARKHNNANILAMGERIVESDLAIEILDLFLSTGFEGNQHTARVEKLSALGCC